MLIMPAMPVNGVKHTCFDASKAVCRAGGFGFFVSYS